MAKLVTIMQNKISQTFSSVKKIRTNLTGEGTQNWVPEDEAADYAKIKKISISKNDTYYAEDDDKDAYNEVKVRVPDEKLKLSTIRITENGTYSAASQSLDGFSGVEVNVQSSGGGDYTFSWEKILDEGHSDNYINQAILKYNDKILVLDTDNVIYEFNGSSWGTFGNSPSTANNQGLCELNGELYLWANNDSGYITLYKYINGTFTQISRTQAPGSMTYFLIGYKNQIHMLGPSHKVFDGANWTTLSTTPGASTYTRPIVAIYNEALCVTTDKTRIWEEPDTWTDLADFPYNYMGLGHTAIVITAANGTRMHSQMYSDYVAYHDSFNGQFWRPEEPCSNNGQLVELNGELYSIADGSTYKATVITGD